MRTEYTLKASKEVPSQDSHIEQSAALSAGTGDIFVLCASAAFTPEACVRVVWDYGGAGEETVWSEKGSRKIDLSFSFTSTGTEKIALILENTSAGPLWLSGSVKFEVIT